MQKKIVLLLLVSLFIVLVSCSKENANQTEAATQYSQTDAKNRNLKDAIEYYNKGLYRASGSSLEKARSQSLKDEDITVMNDLDKMIEEITEEAIINLDLLSETGGLHEFDFAFNSVQSNYETSSFRQKLEESKKKYLSRVKNENDIHLGKYHTLLQKLEKETTLTMENNSKVFISKTSPLRVKMICDGYEMPKAFLEFRPSQKETELETIRFKSNNNDITFAKNTLTISEYNLSTSKVISFDLLLPEAKLNLNNFRQMLKDGSINISLKWFYEPEYITVSGSNIDKMKAALDIYQNLSDEYKLVKENIYSPKHIK